MIILTIKYNMLNGFLFELKQVFTKKSEEHKLLIFFSLPLVLKTPNKQGIT